jgi:hypothetical protein
MAAVLLTRRDSFPLGAGRGGLASAGPWFQPAVFALGGFFLSQPLQPIYSCADRCYQMLARHEKPPLMFYLIWLEYTPAGESDRNRGDLRPVGGSGDSWGSRVVQARSRRSSARTECWASGAYRDDGAA